MPGHEKEVTDTPSGNKPGPSGIPSTKFTKDDSFLHDLSSIQQVSAGADQQTALLERKRTERLLLLSEIIAIRNLIVSIDASNETPEQVSAKIAAHAPRLEAKETELLVLSGQIRELSLQLLIVDRGDDIRAQEHLGLLEEAKGYLNQIKDWVAAEALQGSRSRSASADDECWDRTLVVPNIVIRHFVVR